MTTIGRALVLLFAMGSSIGAQDVPTGPTGTWIMDAPLTTMTLKVDGAVLTATVVNGPAISEGRFEKDIITFKVQFPDGGRTATFTGTLDGDEIRFTRELVVPKGAAGGGAGIFGALGPSEFRMYRLVEGSTWSGTVRNAPTPRNPTPQPNLRQVSLSTRKAPTPHWRWRESRTMEVRTYRLVNATFELSTFEHQGDRLSFLYTQGESPWECLLSRQAEGRFEGTCQNSGGGNPLLIDLTPPSAATQTPAAPGN